MKKFKFLTVFAIVLMNGQAVFAGSCLKIAEQINEIAELYRSDEPERRLYNVPESFYPYLSNLLQTTLEIVLQPDACTAPRKAKILSVSRSALCTQITTNHLLFGRLEFEDERFQEEFYEKIRELAAASPQCNIHDLMFKDRVRKSE